jgi:hypothetical protein
MSAIGGKADIALVAYEQSAYPNYKLTTVHKNACRHSDMTELEEVARIEGQGRALSGHKTAQVYRGYATLNSGPQT